MTFVFVNCTAETFTPTRSGAICTIAWETCRAASKTGFEPWVITRTSPAAPYQWPKTVFVEYPHIPRNHVLSKLWYVHRDITGWGHVRQKAYNLRVASAIRRSRLDRLPLLLNNDIELAVFLRRQFPRASIVHLAHNRNPCSEKFRRLFAGAVDMACAVSDDCGRWNREYFGLDRITTVYPGVDIERFHPATRWPAGLPVINFVGRTDHSKGTDLLLLAAVKLAERGCRFSLQILGASHYGYSVWDEFQQRMADLTADLEVRGVRVSRPGFVDRYALPDELRKAHANVVPSRWEEPFGLATVEGMATGLATVASRAGGTPEIVGDSGLLFDRGDVDALADCLDRLIMDKGALVEYGRRARERSIEFTWNRTWARLRGVLGV